MNQANHTIEPPNTDKEEVEELHIEDLYSEKNFLIFAVVFCVTFLLLIIGFDVFIDVISNISALIAEVLAELFHLSIEIIEEIAESSLHNIIPENRQKNEAIIVNLSILLVFLLIYKLLHSLRLTHSVRRYINAKYLNFKKRIFLSWQLLPIMAKVRIGSVPILAIGSIFLFAV